MHLLTAAVILKVATLAPEGSSWMKLFHQWQTKVEQRTEGRVKVKFYAGGIQGDERDVIRKIRGGQLGGAAITGVGLSLIAPEVRVLEACRTYEDLDHARGRLDATLRKKFEEKGYVLLGWGDVGPIHIFSQRPLKSLADLRQTKLWLWSDDPNTKGVFEVLGIRGVPLGVPEVLPALSTGTIDAFLGSPLSTVALQWSSHAKFATSMTMGIATGATVISKKLWDEVSPADQKVVVEEGKAMETELQKLIRTDNDNALQKMKSAGLQVVASPPAFEKELADLVIPLALKTAAAYSKEFQVEVEKVLTEYRRTHAAK
jgi:TRAP-type C4-dicarboxylate transport system substrate-binding protein